MLSKKKKTETYVVESRTKKLPGWAFRKSAIASSREMVGLYQNFDESRTNLLKWDVMNVMNIDDNNGKIEEGENSAVNATYFTKCGAISCGSLFAVDVVELRRDV